MIMNDRLDSWLGKDNYMVYCISLVRATERRRRFTEFASSIGLSFTFWDAVDKHSLTDDDTELANVHLQGVPSDGATACRVSIHRCLDTFFRESDRKYILIFEDDAGFDAHGRRTPSTPTQNSRLESLCTFIDACRDQVSPSEWMQVWFGYYDDDQQNHVPMTTDDVVYRCTGTSCTHAMLFRRDAVQVLMYGLLRKDARHLPIDWFTKTMMEDVPTLIPKRTIIAQTDDHSFVHAS